MSFAHSACLHRATTPLTAETARTVAVRVSMRVIIRYRGRHRRRAG